MKNISLSGKHSKSNKDMKKSEQQNVSIEAVIERIFCERIAKMVQDTEGATSGIVTVDFDEQTMLSIMYQAYVEYGRYSVSPVSGPEYEGTRAEVTVFAATAYHRERGESKLQLDYQAMNEQISYQLSTR